MLDPLEKLAAVLGRLPGIGRRTAERIVLRLVRDRQRGLTADLIDALEEVGREVVLCEACGSPTVRERNPCRLCTDPGRDRTLLCVVEDPGDIELIERSGAFHGRYHALMGRASPARGDGPEDIRLAALFKRIEAESVSEIVLALNTDVESDATALYIREALRNKPVRVTRIAHGLPVGSGIAYSDPVTLSRALEWRREL